MYDKFGRKALRRKPDGHCVLVQALVSWSVARGDADAPLAYQLVRLLQRSILTTPGTFAKSLLGPRASFVAR